MNKRKSVKTGKMLNSKKAPLEKVTKKTMPKANLQKKIKIKPQEFEEERKKLEKQKQRKLNFKNLSLAHGLVVGLHAAWLIPTLIAWPIMIQNISQNSIILTSLVMIFIVVLLGSFALITVTVIYFIYEKIMRTKINYGQILTLIILILMTILSYSFFLNYFLARI